MSDFGYTQKSEAIMKNSDIVNEVEGMKASSQSKRVYTAYVMDITLRKIYDVDVGYNDIERYVSEKRHA